MHVDPSLRALRFVNFYNKQIGPINQSIYMAQNTVVGLPGSQPHTNYECRRNTKQKELSNIWLKI